MIDDRPIKPDRKYLQQYIERISKVEKKDFLKRKSQPVLPCFSHIPEKHQNGSTKRDNQKSKAQLYEQIKKKNRKRFGEKNIQIVEDPPAKKIDPSKMTVNYKPKNGKAKIGTEEYKLKKETSPKPRTKSIANKQEKVQYDRLLDYFQKQLSEFEKEKEQFSKVAGKLKFKQSICHQPGLQYSRVKRQVQNNLLGNNISMLIEQNNVREGHSGQNNKLKTVRECQNKQQVDARKPLSKTYSIEQIRNCMEKTSQQMHKLKQKMLNRQLFLQQHRYDIHQIYLLPQFDPITIYDYIDHKKLKFNGNEYYNQALSAFNSKFERGDQDPKRILYQQEQNKVKTTIKVKYVGETRVMKYEGWTEVWMPGKQRLMANKEGYKVIWLGNGDVLQEFPNSIKAYYSKVKDVVKIQFKKEPAIYYHHPTHQLWRIVENKIRQTVFSNGAQQTIQQKQKDDDF